MSAPEIRNQGRQRGAGAPNGQGKRREFKGLKPQSHNLTTGWPLPDSGAGCSEHPKVMIADAAYFSDGGHRFQSDRGQRFAAKADSISS
jgi:hypothetical protein